jgi:hypothetical protein
MVAKPLTTWIFLGLCGAAALAPLYHQEASQLRRAQETDLPDWPGEIEDKPLTLLPLSPDNLKFASIFPGKITECTDGERDYILRWVGVPTRMLHSSADCFRARGFTITPGGVWRDPVGTQWATFHAFRGNRHLRVRERISDQAGKNWTDLSSWYWNAMTRNTSGPWLAVTVVEPL